MGTTTTRHRLAWEDGRWHCDGLGIHAGDGMEMLMPDGHWLPVRIESADSGRTLFAYFTYHGMSLRIRVDPAEENLRWPDRPAHRYQPG